VDNARTAGTAGKVPPIRARAFARTPRPLAATDAAATAKLANLANRRAAQATPIPKIPAGPTASP
jgi:hypothetical protein